MAQQPLVRIGVYTGIILGLQYTLIFFQPIGILMVVFMGLFFWSALTFPWGMRQGQRSIQRDIPQWIRLIGWGMGLLFTVLVFAGGAWVFFLILSPVLFLMTYVLLFVRLIKTPDVHASRTALGWPWLLGWFGSYAAAWGGSIALAIHTYRSLPTQPPDCYVCTAASKGHRRVVGATRAVAADGGGYSVNRQMRVLKAAELAILATMPRGHRALRWGYDRVGPRLARRLCRPWLADLAYLTLKPVEIMAHMALYVLCPEADRRIASLYRSCADR